MQEPRQLAALVVLLEHPVLASDPQLLCSTAQVCSSWRAAVAASGAGTTEITLTAPRTQAIDDAPSNALLWKISGFAVWLPAHAHLVRSIAIQRFSVNRTAMVSTACQLLALSLQAAVRSLRPLRLQQFSTDITSRALLAALPDSLTELKIEDELLFRMDFKAEATGAALAGLKGLRVLHLFTHTELSTLSGLCNLTEFKLHTFGHKEHWEQLQQAVSCLSCLQVLSLRFHFYSSNLLGADQAPRLCLTALSALTNLSIAVKNHSRGVPLPAQLAELTLDLADVDCDVPGVDSPFDTFQVETLPSLCDLRVLLEQSLAEIPGSSAMLKRLTNLQHLGLRYGLVDAAEMECANWASFPGLSRLSIAEMGPAFWRVGEDVELCIFAALSRVTALTSFRANVAIHHSVEVGSDVHVCHHLSGLTKLQALQLYMSSGRLAPRDCLALSTLSSLTELRLGRMEDAVDDMVAVALVSNMPRLRHLDLAASHLQTDALIPLLARHKQLTWLDVLDCPGFDERRLGVLARMHKDRQQQQDPLELGLWQQALDAWTPSESA